MNKSRVTMVALSLSLGLGALVPLPQAEANRRQGAPSAKWVRTATAPGGDHAKPLRANKVMTRKTQRVATTLNASISAKPASPSANKKRNYGFKTVMAGLVALMFGGMTVGAAGVSGTWLVEAVNSGEPAAAFLGIAAGGLTYALGKLHVLTLGAAVENSRAD